MNIEKCLQYYLDQCIDDSYDDTEYINNITISIQKILDDTMKNREQIINKYGYSEYTRIKQISMNNYFNMSKTNICKDVAQQQRYNLDEFERLFKEKDYKNNIYSSNK